jgi:hypothetical protein
MHLFMELLPSTIYYIVAYFAFVAYQFIAPQPSYIACYVVWGIDIVMMESTERTCSV